MKRSFESITRMKWNYATYLSRALLALGLITLCSLGAMAQDTAVTPAATDRPESAKSTIKGRVLRGGKPIKGVAVTLRSLGPGGSGTQSATTNVKGEFIFSKVAAGRYSLSAATSIMEDLSWLRGPASEQSKTVSVDGTDTLEIDLILTPPATISGRVTYADGEPVVSSRMIVYRAQDNGLARVDGETYFTDDRGSYRIGGLSAGSYVVGIAEDRSDGPTIMFREDEPHNTLPVGFYPAARTVTAAKPIVVDTGENATGFDITLSELGKFRLSGKLSWRKARVSHTPFSYEASLSIEPIDEPNRPRMSRTGRSILGRSDFETWMPAMSDLIFDRSARIGISDDGNWSIGDLAPGQYRLVVEWALERTETPSDGRRERPIFLSKQIPLTIRDRDLTDINLVLGEGASISGTISGIPESLGKLIRISTIDPLTNESPTGPAFSKEDNSFVLRGLPAGEFLLDFVPMTGAPLYIRSATLGGVDLLQTPIRVQEDQSITGVHVVLGTDLATLSGLVADENGKPELGATVVLVSADRSRWNRASSYFFAVADREGKFSMQVPPGGYLALTGPFMAAPFMDLREIFQRFEAQARLVGVGPSEQKTIDLPMIVRQF